MAAVGEEKGDDAAVEKYKYEVPEPMESCLRSMETTHRTILMLRCKVVVVGDATVGKSACDLGVPRRCLHFNTTRVHLTMTWVVSFLLKRPFGPL